FAATRSVARAPAAWFPTGGYRREAPSDFARHWSNLGRSGDIGRTVDSLVLIRHLCRTLGAWNVIDAEAPTAPSFAHPLVGLEGRGPVRLSENPVEMEKNVGPRAAASGRSFCSTS